MEANLSSRPEFFGSHLTCKVEAELDAFVEKRAREAKDAENVEELWLKSERDHCEKRRHQNGLGWIRHYEGLARAHRTLAEENDGKAARVRGLLGLPIEEKGAV